MTVRPLGCSHWKPSGCCVAVFSQRLPFVTSCTSDRVPPSFGSRSISVDFCHPPARYNSRPWGLVGTAQPWPRSPLSFPHHLHFVGDQRQRHRHDAFPDFIAQPRTLTLTLTLTSEPFGSGLGLGLGLGFGSCSQLPTFGSYSPKSSSVGVGQNPQLFHSLPFCHTISVSWMR